MARPAPRTLEVIRSGHITPNMLRVTLGGAGLADFPQDQESAYIKLIFSQAAEARPVMRTYTVSRQRSREIDVDFALHEAPGPASTWAVEARGYVVLQVTAAADIQRLDHPPGMAVHWVVDCHADPGQSPLHDRIEQLAWLPGQPAVWAACEFRGMRALREHFKQVRQVPKSHLYISSYWKRGCTEDQHKIEKRDDAQAEDE